jgi:hypothetical protein
LHAFEATERRNGVVDTTILMFRTLEKHFSDNEVENLPSGDIGIWKNLPNQMFNKLMNLLLCMEKMAQNTT